MPIVRWRHAFGAVSRSGRFSTFGVPARTREHRPCPSRTVRRGTGTAGKRGPSCPRGRAGGPRAPRRARPTRRVPSRRAQDSSACSARGERSPPATRRAARVGMPRHGSIRRAISRAGGVGPVSRIGRAIRGLTSPRTFKARRHGRLASRAVPRSPAYVPRDQLVQPGAWDTDDPELRSGIEPRVVAAVRLQQRLTRQLAVHRRANGLKKSELAAQLHMTTAHLHRIVDGLRSRCCRRARSRTRSDWS